MGFHLDMVIAIPDIRIVTAFMIVLKRIEGKVKDERSLTYFLKSPSVSSAPAGCPQMMRSMSVKEMMCFKAFIFVLASLKKLDIVMHHLYHVS